MSGGREGGEGEGDKMWRVSRIEREEIRRRRMI